MEIFGIRIDFFRDRIKYFIPFIFFYGSVAYAAESAVSAGLGDLAQDLMTPVGVVSSFVHTACFILGGSFLFACIVKYYEHKRSPLMVPISTVVFLLIAGLVLIALPLVGNLSENGVHYSFINDSF